MPIAHLLELWKKIEVEAEPMETEPAAEDASLDEGLEETADELCLHRVCMHRLYAEETFNVWRLALELELHEPPVHVFYKEVEHEHSLLELNLMHDDLLAHRSSTSSLSLI